MAFNRTDTRQRAYNKIDAYQPHGNWVDERSYNRAKKGCLMGNWYEESSLCTPGGEEPAVHKVIAGERMFSLKAKPPSLWSPPSNGRSVGGAVNERFIL